VSGASASRSLAAGVDITEGASTEVAVGVNVAVTVGVTAAAGVRARNVADFKGVGSGDSAESIGSAVKATDLSSLLWADEVPLLADRGVALVEVKGPAAASRPLGSPGSPRFRLSKVAAARRKEASSVVKGVPLIEGVSRSVSFRSVADIRVGASGAPSPPRAALACRFALASRPWAC
jgi:hypothetical protein